jgi:restriction system protein
MNEMPTFDALMNPLLEAMRALGGSGSIDEIYEKVVELQEIPEEITFVPHNPEKSNQTEVAYRLAWARTYLKKYDLLENSSRGVWSLTQKGNDCGEINTVDVLRYVRQLDREQSLQTTENTEVDLPNSEPPEEAKLWREELHHLLTQEISPDAFERLTQRILRESGFVQVEVTGKTGDGGIDGKGIARINGLMSFHVIFQCKKYQGSVSAGDIRDFRGAMIGRADKGLFITTGTFTPAAIKEATRDGAPPVDLIDGDGLAEKLKELSLGVETTLVEKITVNKNWFLGL